MIGFIKKIGPSVETVMITGRIDRLVMSILNSNSNEIVPRIPPAIKPETGLLNECFAMRS
jgi:hypothetical protein